LISKLGESPRLKLKKSFIKRSKRNELTVT
jgi:hypothetical protein